MSAFFLESVCVVCGTRYGRKECSAAQDGKISHGYCPQHGAEALADLKRRQAEKDVTADSFAPLTPPGWVLLAAVAEIVGLPAKDVHTVFRPAAWRDGFDFADAQGFGMCYRVASLPGLVGELAVSGQTEAAKRLMAWLTPEDGEGAVVAAEPQGPEGGDSRELPWWRRGEMA